jgi:CheY-like chemotaxis protein
MGYVAHRPSTAARTILVVDDDDAIRALLRAMIERGPHRVIEAINGEAALSAIRRSRPDLVVLDVNMPGPDGPEVCRQLRADATTRGLPVLVLTAAVQEEERRRALDAGATGFLKKPFSPLALLDLIEAHLGAA